ncbi:enoyl-CoA hydratase-related protein [Oleomonas cavernae]|nr:enoyl-CoA hydratase-related protein [Oleomonas cavernae]
MTDLPVFREFRVESAREGLVHLVFDMPDRSMNVFSNAAIHELGRFAAWLRDSDVAGVVIRSGKSAFCAGADLNELGVAYDMIMQSPRGERGRVAYDHFFPLSQALRALETSGKPVAAAINGLALGGGCEFALAAHYRVLTDSPRTALGLPESLVGLLPGAGGTQRLPRLVGVAAALPVLLEGKRLSPVEAMLAGVADIVVPVGEEVAAAERWLLSKPRPTQPWDEPDWHKGDEPAALRTVEQARQAVLAASGDRYPAPLAILDCIAGGFPRPMDEAIAWEMDVFSRLIQRPEPRNMIQTLFLGKLEFEKRAKAASLPTELDTIETAILGALRFEIETGKAAGLPLDVIDAAVQELGIGAAAARLHTALPVPGAAAGSLVAGGESAGLWFEGVLTDPVQALAARLLARSAAAVSPYADRLAAADQRVIDYALVASLGFPAYLGGPFALRRYLGGSIPG